MIPLSQVCCANCHLLFANCFFYLARAAHHVKKINSGARFSPSEHAFHPLLMRLPPCGRCVRVWALVAACGEINGGLATLSAAIFTLLPLRPQKDSSGLFNNLAGGLKVSFGELFKDL